MHRLTLLLLLPSALVLSGLMTVNSAAGADATVSIAPASQTVNQGAAFTLEVKQNSAVAVSGIQVDFNFNAGLIQIVGVTKGSAYDGASFLMGVAPQTKEQAIAEANTTGTLQNVASYFLPGTGQVAPGEATFISVAMQAKNGGGTSDLSVSGIEMFDTSAGAITVTPNGGSVTVTGAPAPTATPCPACTPTPSPSPSPPPPPTPPPSPAPPLEASLSISPGSTLVPPGADFTVTVMQKSNRVSTGAQTDLKFNPAILQVVDVTKGKAYQAGQVIMGIVPPAPATPPPSDQRKPQTIALANSSGTLENVAAFFVPGSCPPSIPCSVPPGDAPFLTVKLKGIADGRSALELANMEIIDEQGEGIGVGASNGEVEVRTGAPLPGSAALGAAAKPAALPTAGGDPSGGLLDGVLGWVLMLSGLLAAGVGSATLLRRVRRS
jgi:hypothetical protein